MKNIYKTGDQFAEKGTTGWADWQRSRMKHAIKDVHFEAREIVQVIRDMCEGEEPAWHLMTRPDGIGFRSFEEFVTSPEGLAYPDYAKFRGLAVSEPGVMGEREYDLLTKSRKNQGKRTDVTSPSERKKLAGKTKAARLRAIDRAPPLIRRLYNKGLINVYLAELLGPSKKAPAERKVKAQRALSAIQALAQNGDDAAYRKKVNECVRREFPRASPSALEQAKRAYAKLSKREQEQFRKWANKQEF